MVRFYTYAPVDYAWSLRNIHQKYQEKSQHEIVDIGINDLLKPPHRHKAEKLDRWKTLETTGWKVVPDCPRLPKTTDYFLSYSQDLLLEFYNPSDSTHLPVIHGSSVMSYHKYCLWFKNRFGSPDKIGVGSLKAFRRDKNTVQIVLRVVRRVFPNAWIHAFGLHLDHICPEIDSYDSTSWTFPRGSGRGSCKNKAERITFFYEYIKRIPDYTSNQKRIRDFLH